MINLPNIIIARQWTTAGGYKDVGKTMTERRKKLSDRTGRRSRKQNYSLGSPLYTLSI
jgi:hypothetical protein